MYAQDMVMLGSQRSVIRELFEYGNQRAAQVGRENVFDFSLGNPSVPSPGWVNESIRQLLDTQSSLQLHGYTSAPGDLTARQAVAADLNRRFGTNYTGAELYLTAGAAAALCACFRALAEPGDEFVAIAPYFPEYRCFVEQGAGAKLRVAEADTETFQINFESLAGCLNPHTKAVIVNSPNNPSGAVYTAETVQKLADMLRSASEEYGHPNYLISDEPYREIVYDGPAPFLPAYYDNTLVCYSWSKSLSLPGERIGYVLVPGDIADSGDVYAAVAGAGRSLGYVNAPSLFQQVTSLCCDMTSDLSVYERNAKLLVTSLREMGYHVVEPGGAFYLFPRSLEPDDLAFSERAKQFDLLLVPGAGFGAPGHVRIAYCVQTEMIERSLPKFKALADSYRK